MDLRTITAIRPARTRDDLAGLGDDVAALAGGTWLFSEPQDHLRELVDLTTLGWPALALTEDGGLEIAATATLAELSALARGGPVGADPAPEGWRSLGLAHACCEMLLGSWKVWGQATVGGNLCLALPAGPMSALLGAWDASALVWQPDGGERTLAAVDVVTGDRTTSLAPGEVLRSLHVPPAALASRTAVRQASLTNLGRSASVVVARLAPDGGVTLTITAATPAPHVLSFPTLPDADALRAAVDERVGPGGWFDDVHGDPAWRAHLTHLLTGQVLDELAAA